MNLNKIKLTMATGMLAASMILPGMTAYAVDGGTNSGLKDNCPSIEKYVKVADGITVPTTGNDQIKFVVEQYDANGTEANITNPDGTVQPAAVTTSGLSLSVDTLTAIAKSDTASENGWTLNGYEDNGANKKGSATLDANSQFTNLLTNNGEYTFTLKEDTSKLPKDAEGYGWSTVDSDKTYYLHVYVTGATKSGSTVDTSNRKVQYIVTDAATHDTSSDPAKYATKVDQIRFNNTYTKKAGSDIPTDPDDPKKGASLVIEKAVNGASAKYEADGTEYEFKVTFTASNTAVATDGYSYSVYKTGSTTPVKTNQTVKSGDTIPLESGQYAVFTDIPAGLKVQVEETGTLTNIKSTKNVVVSNGGSSVTKEGNDGKNTGAFLLGEKANTATFTNTYADVTVTGVVTDIAPYVTLVVVAIAAVAAYMGLKSRIAR